MAKSSAFWLWMLKVATGTPKLSSQTQPSSFPSLMLVRGCCLSCSGHSHSTGQHLRERKRERVEQSRVWGVRAPSEREQHRGSS